MFGEQPGECGCIEQIKVTRNVVAAPVPATKDAGVPAARIGSFDRQQSTGAEQACDPTDGIARVARVLDHLMDEGEREAAVPAGEVERLEVARADLEAALGRTPRRSLRHLDPGEAPSRRPEAPEDVEEAAVAA